MPDVRPRPYSRTARTDRAVWHTDGFPPATRSSQHLRALDQDSNQECYWQTKQHDDQWKREHHKDQKEDVRKAPDSPPEDGGASARVWRRQ